MSFSLDDIFNTYEYTDDEKSVFSGFNIVDVLYKKSDELVIFKIENDFVLPYKQYEDLLKYFNEAGFDNVRLYFKVKDGDLTVKEIGHYLYAYKKLFNCFGDAVVTKDDEGMVLSYVSEDSYNRDNDYLEDLKLFFCNVGYRKEIKTILKDISNKEVETREPLPEEPKREYSNNNNNNFQPKEGFNKGGGGQSNGPKPNYYKPKTRTYTDITIDDLVDTLYSVRFTGQIFKVDEKVTKTQTTIQTIFVKDENNACVVKVIEGRRFSKDDLKNNKEGKWATFYGNYRFDTFGNDYIFEPDQIEFVDEPNPLKDDEPIKRVELHAHSKLSEMDGVSSPTDLVKAAYSMGHRAVALTDHLCLQGFHEAYLTYRGIKKGADKDTFDFKMLYGCELNVVNPHLNIVYNATDDKLADQEYVVFDLETTGLSSEYDYTIEFGAVLMYKGEIKEQKDFFIKPPFALSEQIKNLTNITDDDVRNARTFEEAKDEILDFIKGRVLVAHNASFDYGFLNSELKRLGLPRLENPVIDTLDLSRSLFKTRRAYRLGNMARQYGVLYDEEVAHRANYDADVLAQVFNLMLKDLNRNNVTTLRELQDFQGDDAFVKTRAFHTNVLCKNKAGLKDLFKLVSISNTETLAVFGKANSKDSSSDFIAEPRVFKETLNKYRENLLIGSACLNGEVFEIASTRSKEELAKVISFFDFIEIQPLDNYRYLYVDRALFDKERLKTYLRDIIAEAKRQNKIIVATSDCHYVRRDEKILRDVYINAQAIGGAHHPLFLYDKEKRAKQITPDQHFYNTREMLDAFAWLDDEKLIREIVIDNTNKIADMIEEITPFSEELKPPRVLDAIAKAKECRINEEPFCDTDEVINADEYLTRLVHYTMESQYGKDCDQFIKDRVERELNAIIGNGYGVIYYTCHLMVKRSNDDGYIVGSRGSVGSSLVATFSGITEVNPLPPHYVCPKCHHLEWHKEAKSGYDMPDKACPDCGTIMKGNGQNIPFETFMGFNGDKVPDIDLNFSGEYQPKAHLFTREIFGPDNVFRAGTISTVADKTAFGYVQGYCEERGITNMSRAQKERLAAGCTGVKRTTGQHAGGIVVLPDTMEIEDVTPIQFPANDKNAPWRSTHFEYHDYSDNILKFDILGHVDPTAMRLFENISGIDVKTIPMNDERVLSLFSSSKELNIVNPNYHEETGACGLPEFGTLNTRNTIEETRPKVFSDLVQISGLSHGTDVWRGNAQELIRKGIKLADVIGCRDDIMGTLISYDIEPKTSFGIMEKVRKGKGLTPDEEKLMTEHNVPQWYIESCKKIKYMFPKAHAVAYCIMAVRVAWFKVYHPAYYYVSYFTLRCDAYELETMVKDADSIYARMKEIMAKMNSRENPASKKEKDIYNTLEVCYEMVSRGYRCTGIDLYKSLATEFRVNPDNDHEIIPPFKVLDGLGDNVAVSIVEAREQREFLSKEDLMDRTQVSNTLLKKLNELGVLKGLDDSNQISLF
ncbi:MAG: PolC-type DNA polymerase III [Erysipelotrichaceae bacterium]|nr:PolC-type DNA polymerase III [Erysipelotrichaceae bacterium]